MVASRGKNAANDEEGVRPKTVRSPLDEEGTKMKGNTEKTERTEKMERDVETDGTRDMEGTGEVEGTGEAEGGGETELDEETKRIQATEDEKAGRAEKDADGTGGRMTPRELGHRGERAAAVYLERTGFEIIERNWKCPFGEVDLIADDDGTLVFIEVKTRRGIDKGIPEDAVDATKRDRYEKIAACYLSDHEREDCCVRFDVIGLLVTSEEEGHGRALLRHHRDAFAQAC